LAVIILAFFHGFSYHYGALSQKKALALASAFFIKPAYAHDVWRALYSPNPKKISTEVSL